MKLKYKHQPFQADACRMVVRAFEGQPKGTGMLEYDLDKGDGSLHLSGTGYGNHRIVLTREQVAQNVRKIQTEQGLQPIGELQGEGFRLTIEMETGTGKTYTYIKTMYELNAHYGWNKFIVVVPSIAIREGVEKSFQSMAQHFMQEYGKPIQHFVYSSNQLNKIDAFASDPGLHVMIINTQAFNTSMNEEKGRQDTESRGDKAARIIFGRRDEFGSRRPIDVLAQTNPVIIVDEPQSTLGAKKDNASRKGMAQFNPILTLLYSATHREADVCNMVYRLDAIDAYNQHLVKKVEVKGIRQVGNNATNGYIYLDGIVLGKDKNPQARLTFDVKTATDTKQTTRLLNEGNDLKELSGGLAEYADNYVIDSIDGTTGTVRFLNGLVLQEGDSHGNASEDFLRRIQIRETIRTHLERERQLFRRGIKVLSLFFIDHVDSYRLYGQEDQRGKFARMFEEEYDRVLHDFLPTFADEEYMRYLKDPNNTAQRVHQGYFAQDKKGNLVDSKEGKESDNDLSAFDLIMKNKERLLSFDEPVRFLFSHSALKEGWDNPNVFQICTLKNSDNVTKKRQEVGRGMRLCVNQKGERQDADVLGPDVFRTNILTVIASESYDDFCRALQHEMGEACGTRARKVTVTLFENARHTLPDGTETKLTHAQAVDVYDALVANGYVKKEELTQKYYDDKQNGQLNFGEEVNPLADCVVRQLGTLYDDTMAKPENARGKKRATFLQHNFSRKEFQELWKRINARTYYNVKFSSDELVRNAIKELDEHLNVTQVHLLIENGGMDSIRDKEQLTTASAMTKGTAKRENMVGDHLGGVTYDLVGELVTKTGLTRRTIVAILKGISPATFGLFQINPEEFILKAARLINSQKGSTVVEHIAYHKSDDTFGEDIFTKDTLFGAPGVNAIESNKSLYDLVVVDSMGIEKTFAEQLEREDDVVVYTKLPHGFYICTPLGNYNPDWAVALKEGTVKHVYFVAETKGSLDSLELRAVERSKIDCARRHFAAISTGDVKYDVVTSYQDLFNMVTKA